MEIQGSSAGWIASHQESVPPSVSAGNTVKVVHEVWRTKEGVEYVTVESSGPLALGVGSINGAPNGCLTLPPLVDQKPHPGNSDVTDGSCPVIQIGAVLQEVRGRLEAGNIPTIQDILRPAGEGDVFAIAVHDWDHFSSAVAVLADVLGSYRIQGTMAVAVERPLCGEDILQTEMNGFFDT